MPRGDGSKQRRAESRATQASALDILFSPNFQSQPALPTCPSPACEAPGGNSGWRIHIGKVSQFGPFRSPQRQCVIDNFLCVLIAEYGPILSAIQWSPDSARRHFFGASLILFFRPLAGHSSAMRSPISFRILTASGLIVPSLDYVSYIFHYPSAASIPSPFPPKPWDFDNSVLVHMDSPDFTMGLIDPACVTVKIRGLHASLHRQGVTSAFLKAAGYPDSSFSVLSEFYPALHIHGRPAFLGIEVTPPSPTDLSTIFAVVNPPADSPSLSAASRPWILHGHLHPVHVRVFPSSARPIVGHPPLPPPRPIYPGRQTPSPYVRTAGLLRSIPFPQLDPPTLSPITSESRTLRIPSIASFPASTQCMASRLMSDVLSSHETLLSLLPSTPPPPHIRGPGPPSSRERLGQDGPHGPPAPSRPSVLAEIEDHLEHLSLLRTDFDRDPNELDSDSDQGFDFSEFFQV